MFVRVFAGLYANTRQGGPPFVLIGLRNTRKKTKNMKQRKIDKTKKKTKGKEQKKRKGTKGVGRCPLETDQI